MRLPGWPRRLLVFSLATAAIAGGLAHSGTAQAATCSKHRQAFPLHGGSRGGHSASCGRHVADVQWLTAGHSPYVFRQVKPTFKGKTNGLYGARTKAAVKALKYRIGYPAKGQCPTSRATSAVTDTAGREFMLILEGRVKRPTCWVGVAAERVKGAVRTGATPAAAALVNLELSQIGVHEIPDGSNRGPCISTSCRIGTLGVFGPYQAATGAYGQAWCASFWEWALKTVTGHIFATTYPASVPSIVETAHAHNELAAKPRVGSGVAFLSSDLQLVNAFHIGLVIKVTAAGVWTVEGNYANGVHKVWRPYATNHMVYVNAAGVA